MAKKGGANGKSNTEKNSEVELIVQPNGQGALLAGGKPGNKGGTGPPPSAIRAYCRGSFAVRIPILEDIAAGEYKATPRDRIKAMDVLAKYGGVDKLALMPDELPSREITPERVEEMWQRLRMITSIEDFERLLVSAAQKQLSSGDNGQP